VTINKATNTQNDIRRVNAVLLYIFPSCFDLKDQHQLPLMNIQSVPRGKVNILGGTCPIPNGFQDGVISLYCSKIVDEIEILRTISNCSICCSSDKVGTVYVA
jgi:hypothetical protein